MSKVLIPIPSYGFDPTEAAIPWKILTERRIEVSFSTPTGEKADADSIMLTGKGLGIWKPLLRARRDAVLAYSAMAQSTAFSQPIRYADIWPGDFDAILLPGGHDKGVREYLESPILQRVIAEFFSVEKPVAAICHGVLLASRSKDPKTGRSVLFHYKTTSLLRSQERLAYHLTRLWLHDYYLTYPETTVEDEVKTALSDPGQFVKGPFPFLRDDVVHVGRGFVVRDKNYLSARWPGDAYRFSSTLVEMLESQPRPQTVGPTMT